MLWIQTKKLLSGNLAIFTKLLCVASICIGSQHMHWLTEYECTGTKKGQVTGATCTRHSGERVYTKLYTTLMTSSSEFRLRRSSARNSYSSEELAPCVHNFEAYITTLISL